MPDPGTFTVLQVSVTAVITAAAGLPFALWRLRPTYRPEAVVLAEHGHGHPEHPSLEAAHERERNLGITGAQAGQQRLVGQTFHRQPGAVHIPWYGPTSCRDWSPRYQFRRCAVPPRLFSVAR